MTATMRGGDDRGFGLLTVLVWLSLLATAALGVALATASEPLATAAFHERLRLMRAAESALVLAVNTLSTRSDWSTVPAGGLPLPYTDGPAGPRSVIGSRFDLRVETSRRTCGRAAACDDAATVAATTERPWGDRNPRWQLVVHVPLSDLDVTAARPCPCYLVAWVADDPGDDDGDPWRDAPTGVAGHGVLLLRGAAIGPEGAVAEVEALVEQPCRQSSVQCAGIRVQSWGVVRDGIP